MVDFGTATTFDVVDKNGDYLGGVICPGINLSIEALHQAAAQLPRIGIARPQAVIGRSTVPAMQSGVYWGYVGMIEGLVARIKAEYGGPMKVIATGGLAPLFSEGTMVIEQIEPDLTLDGLRLLAERNPAPTLPRETHAADRTRIGAWLVDTHPKKSGLPGSRSRWHHAVARRPRRCRPKQARRFLARWQRPDACVVKPIKPRQIRRRHALGPVRQPAARWCTPSPAPSSMRFGRSTPPACRIRH